MLQIQKQICSPFLTCKHQTTKFIIQKCKTTNNHTSNIIVIIIIIKIKIAKKKLRIRFESKNTNKQTNKKGKLQKLQNAKKN